MKPKIAVFHNLPTGGAKRALYENLKDLKENFEFYLYDLRGPHDDFLNVRPLVKETFTFEFRETPLLPKPFGFLNTFFRIIDLFRLNQLHKKIAQQIDKENYSLIFIFADRFTQTPFLVKHLKTKILYYTLDSYFRSAYEKEIIREEIRKTFKERIKGVLYLPGEFFYKKIIAWQDKINTKKAIKVVICSKFSSLLMNDKYGVLPEVLYPGVDIDLFRPLSLKKENAVISQGSILFRKGHHFIIESLAKIEEKLRPVLFILADSGSEDEEKYLCQLAEKLKVKIKFFKRVNNQKEVVRIYNQALICVCGQIKEPFGLSVLEAGACGLPVVSVDEGGMRESVVDGENGYLVPRDPTLFAKKVEYLIKNGRLRNLMGKWARKYVVNNFSWKILNNKLRNIIEEMIK